MPVPSRTKVDSLLRLVEAAKLVSFPVLEKESKCEVSSNPRISLRERRRESGKKRGRKERASSPLIDTFPFPFSPHLEEVSFLFSLLPSPSLSTLTVRITDRIEVQLTRQNNTASLCISHSSTKASLSLQTSRILDRVLLLVEKHRRSCRPLLQLDRVRPSWISVQEGEMKIFRLRVSERKYRGREGEHRRRRSIWSFEGEEKVTDETFGSLGEGGREG